MTPADLARYSAISFECKKDGLRQTQAGTWKVAFTLQGIDMDERLTKAVPGTRYMMVLVEIDDLELPVHQPAKEVMPNSRKPVSTGPDNAQPQPDTPDKPQPAGAKRMDWRELQPAAQAGIRCAEPIFIAFLKEKYGYGWTENGNDAAKMVRFICGVKSRSELGTNHKARVLWKQLDDQFQAWQRVGA